MSSLKRLEFSAYCDTQYGQFAYICGNIPQLGNWNPLKGLRLYTQQSFYPVWKSFNSVLVIENQPIQFKICIVTSKNEFKWENIQQNRIIVPQMDAYIKLTANEFQTYQIFPYSQRHQPVRRGLDNVLNDLSSDCSSSISFKSNYKFYEYYQHHDNESHYNNRLKQKNTSTFRDLTQYSDERSPLGRFNNGCITRMDSIQKFDDEIQHRDDIINAQQCNKRINQQEDSHSTTSEKDFMEGEIQNLEQQNLVTYSGKDKVYKYSRKSAKKLYIGSKDLRLNSLNKMIHNNSSQERYLTKDE